MDNCNIKEHGGCCCVCKYQVTLHQHPWNQGEWKGPVKVYRAWGCAVEYVESMAGNEEWKEGATRVIYSDREHGMCECFIPRPDFAAKVVS